MPQTGSGSVIAGRAHLPEKPKTDDDRAAVGIQIRSRKSPPPPEDTTVRRQDKRLDSWQGGTSLIFLVLKYAVKDTWC